VSVGTRIVLSTICVFNALILVVVGFLAWFFVDGSGAPIVAALSWLAALTLVMLSRILRRGPEYE
jgi:hypothetical protein